MQNAGLYKSVLYDFPTISAYIVLVPQSVLFIPDIFHEYRLFQLYPPQLLLRLLEDYVLVCFLHMRSCIPVGALR